GCLREIFLNLCFASSPLRRAPALISARGSRWRARSARDSSYTNPVYQLGTFDTLKVWEHVALLLIKQRAPTTRKAASYAAFQRLKTAKATIAIDIVPSAVTKNTNAVSAHARRVIHLDDILPRPQVRISPGERTARSTDRQPPPPVLRRAFFAVSL